MSYEIGYAPNIKSKVSVIQEASARSALRTVLALNAGSDVIRYVKTAGRDIEIGELSLLADREEHRTL